MQAIRLTCIGKPFADLPNSFKGFIDSIFKTIDIDGTSSISSPVTRSNPYFKDELFPLSYLMYDPMKVINSGTLL